MSSYLTTFARAEDDFSTTLPAPGHAAGASTLVLQEGDGARLGALPPNRIYRMTAVINPNTSEEVILSVCEATGISEDTLTGVTAAAGYSNVALGAGVTIERRLTAADIEDHSAAINAVEATIAGLQPSGSDDTAAIHAAMIAAGRGMVKLPPGTFLTTGILLSGMQCAFLGSGDATIIRAISGQTGPVIDFTGYSSPDNAQSLREIGNFTVEGDGTGGTEKIGIDLSTQMVGLWMHDVAIRYTGGSCLKGNWLELSQFDRIVMSTPVNAATNDVPYLHLTGATNGNRFNSFGFRSVTSGPDCGPSGVARIEPDASYAPEQNLLLGWWYEFLHIPTDGTLLHLDGNRNIVSDFQLFDSGRDASATGGTSFYRLARANAGQTWGGNTIQGFIPGDILDYDIDWGVEVQSNGNLIRGIRGIANDCVNLMAGAGGNTIDLAGSDGSPGGRPVLDNSGVATNVIRDTSQAGLNYLYAGHGTIQDSPSSITDDLHQWKVAGTTKARITNAGAIELRLGSDDGSSPAGGFGRLAVDSALNLVFRSRNHIAFRPEDGAWAQFFTDVFNIAGRANATIGVNWGDTSSITFTNLSGGGSFTGIFAAGGTQGTHPLARWTDPTEAITYSQIDYIGAFHPPVLSDAAALDGSMFFGSDHLDGSSHPKPCYKQGGIVSPVESGGATLDANTFTGTQTFAGTSLDKVTITSPDNTMPWSLTCSASPFSGVTDNIVTEGWTTANQTAGQPSYTENWESRYVDGAPPNGLIERHGNYRSIDGTVSYRPWGYSIDLNSHNWNMIWDRLSLFTIISPDGTKTLTYTPAAGTLSIPGRLNAASLGGDGSAITDLDADALATGTIDDAIFPEFLHVDGANGILGIGTGDMTDPADGSTDTLAISTSVLRYSFAPLQFSVFDGTRIGVFGCNSTGVYIGSKSNHPLIFRVGNNDVLVIDAAKNLVGQAAISAVDDISTSTGKLRANTDSSWPVVLGAPLGDTTPGLWLRPTPSFNNYSVLIAGNGTFFNTPAGGYIELRIGNTGQLRVDSSGAAFAGPVGLNGSTPPAKAATPTTLADVIAILQGLGACN